MSRRAAPRPRAYDAHAPEARFAAVAAEPPGPGLGRPRDALTREVRLLGALLGQVIAEQAGRELFATVERIRRRTIALRRGDPLSADANKLVINVYVLIKTGQTSPG